MSCADQYLTKLRPRRYHNRTLNNLLFFFKQENVLSNATVTIGPHTFLTQLFFRVQLFVQDFFREDKIPKLDTNT
jgi:hypothetical protein